MGQQSGDDGEINQYNEQEYGNGNDTVSGEYSNLPSGRWKRGSDDIPQLSLSIIICWRHGRTETGC